MGMKILWDLFEGTDFTDSGVSLNAWGAYASATKTPDQTSTWFTTNDATFEISGVQLEVGSHSTDFEFKSFGQELLTCERYFQKASGYVTQANSHWVSIRPTMRTNPTATISSGNLNSVNQITTTSSNWNNSGNAANSATVSYSAEL